MKDLSPYWKVGKVSYRVKLPLRLKIHHVFHVSYLKPYHGDKDDPSQGLSKRAPIAVVTSYDKKVEHVLADRVIKRLGVPPATEYLRFRRDEDFCDIGGGECHKLIQMSLLMALYRARKLLETPRVGRVWKVLEKPRGIHTILHYGGRHERSLGLSREFQKSLVYTCI
ncbi:hypothetical protein AAG906_002160 [Vitis piasezkii]